MPIYCAECFPALGSFPPDKPLLRKRWFASLLREAAKLRCVSSRGQVKARMKKHKHTSYLFYKKSLKGKHKQDLQVVLLQPLAVSPFYSMKRNRKESK
jgi:hypothetical protein